MVDWRANPVPVATRITVAHGAGHLRYEQGVGACASRCDPRPPVGGSGGLFLMFMATYHISRLNARRFPGLSVLYPPSPGLTNPAGGWPEKGLDGKEKLA